MFPLFHGLRGYAPLSVRLVQMTRSQVKGWLAVKDALSLLHGPAQELQQRAAEASNRAVVLVCFLGAALGALGRLAGRWCDLWGDRGTAALVAARGGQEEVPHRDHGVHQPQEALRAGSQGPEQLAFHRFLWVFHRF